MLIKQDSILNFPLISMKNSQLSIHVIFFQVQHFSVQFLQEHTENSGIKSFPSKNV